MTEWRRLAACQGEDPDLFIPPTGARVASLWQLELRAKKICAACPVREPCERAGYGEPGVWGGYTAKERTQRAGLRGVR